MQKASSHQCEISFKSLPCLESYRSVTLRSNPDLQIEGRFYLKSLIIFSGWDDLPWKNLFSHPVESNVEYITELQIQPVGFNEEFYEDSGITSYFQLVRAAKKLVKICQKKQENLNMLNSDRFKLFLVNCYFSSIDSMFVSQNLVGILSIIIYLTQYLTRNLPRDFVHFSYFTEVIELCV